MPQAILTDSRVTKKAIATAREKDLPEPMQIKTLPIPEKNPVYYSDKHPEAGRGLILKVDRTESKIWALTFYDKGKQYRLALGPWPKMGPAAARIAAGNIRDDVRAGNNPIVDRQSKKQADIDAEAVRLTKTELTLGALCNAYVQQLRRDGKSSARAVETCFQKNVEDAFPKLWNTPAEYLDVDDFLEIVATLTDAGKMRQAAKLRSYLRAAYTVAVRSRTDATATKAMRQFKLTRNPVSDLAPIAGNIKARERVLSLPELRLYFQRIQSEPVLAFHLLTGGQRLEQLFRLTSADQDGSDVTLYDGKGRRRTPRAHVVPLLPEAQAALDNIGNGPYLVSFDGGKTPATDSAFRVRFKAACAAMMKAEEVTEPFTPGDIRRTVETRLAATGVTSDELAQLLSHGLGGIQQRHYQRHDFHAEKLAALVTLRDLLTAPTGVVVPMKRRAKK
jgi:integrase